MAKLTLARKIVAIALRMWKTGEVWDATKLNVQGDIPLGCGDGDR
jgi:hypothetical protein